MKKLFLIPIALSLFAGSVFAASLTIKCPPIIAVKATKLFSSNSKYVCFNNSSDAKRAGYKDETKVKKTWKLVTTFSGEVDQQTDSFTINASQWRLSWSHAGDGQFSTIVYDANTLDYKKLMVNTIGSTVAKSNYYGAGRFYLDISGDSAWTVVVEEYR